MESSVTFFRLIFLTLSFFLSGCGLIGKHTFTTAKPQTAPNNTVQSISGPQIGNYSITFLGLVSDSFGSGVQNATVTAQIGNAAPVSAQTDSRGDYDFTVIGSTNSASETIILCATANGFPQSCQQIFFDGSQLTYNENFTFASTFSQIGNYRWTFQGNVYDTNHLPISGANVTLSMGGNTVDSVNTLSTGAYSFTATGYSSNSSEVVSLCASAQNFSKQCVNLTLTTATDTLTEDLALPSSQGALGNYTWTFKGHVKDISGNNVSASISIQIGNYNPIPAATDGFGNYNVTIQGSSSSSSLNVNLCASASGYQQQCFNTNLNSPQDTITQDFGLASSQIGIGNYQWFFSGIVQDTQRNALPNARVTVTVDGSPQDVFTDLTGQYQLTLNGFTTKSNVAVGICARHSGYADDCVSFTLNASSENVVEDFALLSQPNGLGNYHWLFQGRIVNTHNNTISGAQVSVVTTDGNSNHVNADSQGNYSLVLDGTTTMNGESVTLCAQAYEYKKSCASFNLTSATDTITEDFSLPYSGLGDVSWNFSGRVTSDNQTPLSSADIWITAPDGTQLASTKTDSAGYYSTNFIGVDVNTTDSLTICADTLYFNSQCITKTVSSSNASLSINFTLTPETIGNYLWTFSGHIDKTLGGPAIGAVVTVTLQGSGKSGQASVDSNGDYSLSLSGSDSNYQEVANICAGGPTYQEQCAQQSGIYSSENFTQNFSLVYLDPKGGAYISAMYQDLFNRGASQNEVTYWVGQLAALGPYQVALDLVTSDEHRTIVIEGYYQTFLGRSSDSAGMQYWLTQVRNGMAIEEISVRFVSSDEYYKDNGGNDTDFIKSLYRRFLNREAEDSGLRYWVTELAGGMSRADVARGFVTSDEYRGNLIRQWYQLYLHRTADAGGVSYWVNSLRSSGTLETVQADLISSPEYHAALH